MNLVNQVEIYDEPAPQPSHQVIQYSIVVAIEPHSSFYKVKYFYPSLLQLSHGTISIIISP